MIEYTSGIQTFRAYGIAGTKNDKMVNHMKAYSDVNFIYEVKLIPVGLIRNILNWSILPLVMWLAAKPWLAGELSSSAYFIICLLTIYLAKLVFTLTADCLGYQNNTISKMKQQPLWTLKMNWQLGKLL